MNKNVKLISFGIFYYIFTFVRSLKNFNIIIVVRRLNGFVLWIMNLGFVIYVFEIYHQIKILIQLSPSIRGTIPCNDERNLNGNENDCAN